MKISDSATIPSQVLARRIGEETVILNLESGVYFGLDPVGARIWELLTDGNELAGICETMQLEFEVDRETLGTDVRRLVQDLEKQGLIISTQNL
jgi:hypothetical protein